MTTSTFTRLKSFHIIAILNLLFGVCMVLLGAYVKNSGSSLACPDWPLCHGQVLPEMTGGVAIEHSHRLLGSFLGLLSLSLGFLSFKTRKSRPLLWKGSLIAIALVIFQGTLGGITVLKQISPHVSTVHWMTSQIYLAVLLWLALRSRVENLGVTHLHQPPLKIQKWLNIGMAVLLIQFLLGAIVRHSGAGMACGLGWQSAIKCQELTTAELVWWPQSLLAKIQMKHKFWGIFTFLFVVFSTLPFLKWAKRNNIRSIRLQVVGIHICLFLQVLIGMKVLGTHLSNFSVLLHVFFAMAIWLLLVSLRFKVGALREKT